MSNKIELKEILLFELPQGDKVKLQGIYPWRENLNTVAAQEKAASAYKGNDYLDLRCLTLQYYGFIEGKADCHQPEILFYMMKNPPWELEIQVLRYFQKLDEKASPREALEEIIKYLPCMSDTLDLPDKINPTPSYTPENNPDNQMFWLEKNKSRILDLLNYYDLPQDKLLGQVYFEDLQKAAKNVPSPCKPSVNLSPQNKTILQGFYYIWVNEESPCQDCRALSKKVYMIDNIPEAPHFGCKCKVVPLSKLSLRPKHQPLRVFNQISSVEDFWWLPDVDKKLLALKKAYDKPGADKKAIAAQAAQIRAQNSNKYVVRADKPLSYYLPEDISQKLLEKLVRTEYIYSENFGLSWVMRLGEFIDLVDNSKPLDLKRQEGWGLDNGYNRSYGRSYSFDNMVLRYDDPGNIAYGYIGKVFGIPDEILKLGAGIKNLYDYYKRNHRLPPKEWVISNYGDDPLDAKMIKKGIDLYHNMHKI